MRSLLFIMMVIAHPSIGQKNEKLFNGQDLTGWKVYGTEKWFVEKNELVCESGTDKRDAHTNTNTAIFHWPVYFGSSGGLQSRVDTSRGSFDTLLTRPPSGSWPLLPDSSCDIPSYPCCRNAGSAQLLLFLSDGLPIR